jgi:hypothetical protein
MRVMSRLPHVAAPHLDAAARHVRTLSKQNKMRYAFRMARGVRDRSRATLRHPEEHESLQAECVDDRLKIANPILEQEGGGDLIGESAAPLVVADASVIPRELSQPMHPKRTACVTLDMAEPRGHLQQGRPLAARRGSNRRAVPGLAEGDPLLDGSREASRLAAAPAAVQQRNGEIPRRAKGGMHARMPIHSCSGTRGSGLACQLISLPSMVKQCGQCSHARSHSLCRAGKSRRIN